MPVRRLVAALALAAGLAAAFAWVGSNGATTQPVIAPTAEQAAAAEFAEVSPEEWRAAFPLTTPDLQPFAGAVAAPIDGEIAKAYASLVSGRYAEAATQFESIWIDHPDRREAALYLGVARLFMDEVPAGIEVLRQAQAGVDDPITAYAQWYALVGIARLREPASGMVEALEVCQRPGPFSAQACAALERLRQSRL